MHLDASPTPNPNPNPNPKPLGRPAILRDPELIAAALDLRKQGQSYLAIARALKLSRRGVEGVCKAAGLDRARVSPRLFLSRAEALRDSGLSHARIAETLHLSERSVGRLLRQSRPGKISRFESRGIFDPETAEPRKLEVKEATIRSTRDRKPRFTGDGLSVAPKAWSDLTPAEASRRILLLHKAGRTADFFRDRCSTDLTPEDED